MARTTYLVDDHEGVRTAIRRLLELRPDQIVRDFESGEAFLAEADSLEPGVLLLDLNMPGLSGLEVLEKLQSRHRGKFIVLILTGTDTVPHALGPMRGSVFRSSRSPAMRKSCSTPSTQPMSSFSRAVRQVAIGRLLAASR